MDNQLDYSKLPWWNKTPRRFQKLACAVGLHIPVEAMKKDGTSDVFCQQCAKPLPHEYHRKFFARARQ